jgi:hypothetical protein
MDGKRRRAEHPKKRIWSDGIGKGIKAWEIVESSMSLRGFRFY